MAELSFWRMWEPIRAASVSPVSPMYVSYLYIYIIYMEKIWLTSYKFNKFSHHFFSILMLFFSMFVVHYSFCLVFFHLLLFKFFHIFQRHWFQWNILSVSWRKTSNWTSCNGSNPRRSGSSKYDSTWWHGPNMLFWSQINVCRFFEISTW